MKTSKDELFEVLMQLVTHDDIYLVSDIEQALALQLGEHPSWLTSTWVGMVMSHDWGLERKKRRSRGYRLSPRIMHDLRAIVGQVVQVGQWTTHREKKV